MSKLRLLSVFLLLAAIVRLLTACTSPSIQSQQNIEKKLAQSQAEPFDGGSTRKAYKRILK